jgi:hypothetical protein
VQANSNGDLKTKAKTKTKTIFLLVEEREKRWLVILKTLC